jgi:hypothetical protein
MLKKLLPRKQQTKLITFTDILGVAEEYAPKPAIHFIPKWYKDMEAYFPKQVTPESTPTIKKMYSCFRCNNCWIHNCFIL